MRNHAWIGRLGALLALGIGAGACGSDSKGAGGSGDGEGDGSAADGDAGSDGSPGDGTDGPVLCGVMDTVCEGDTPVCFNGQCVECTLSDHAACAEGEACNPATHRCDSANTPFALDCANLPTDGACQGGPREVLLVTERYGRVLMFDPVDGHFLGYFKREVADFQGTYWVATQGADQCIWSTGDGAAVERYDTDGTLKDVVLPHGKYFDGQDDLIQSPHALAFTADSVYVASSQGEPHDRISRFPLAGLGGDSRVEPEVVLDDGTDFGSMLVLGDGSLIVRNPRTAENVGAVEHIAAGSSEHVNVLGSLSTSPYGQVSYAGGGKLLVGDEGTGTMYLVSIADGTTQAIQPDGYDSVRGAALLYDGRWMFTTRGGIRALDPESVQPTGQSVSLWNDPAVPYLDFQHIGRACLSNEFVEAAQPEPPDACDEPEGAALFEENFDMGTLGQFTTIDYTEPENSYEHKVTATIEASGAEESAGSLKVEYAPGFYDGSDLIGDPSILNGVQAPLGDIKPTYIGYYVRTDVVDADAGYFELNTRDVDMVERIYLGYSDTNDGDLMSVASNVHVPVRQGQWMRVQMRNIDWTARNYDLYVDCERAAEDVPFFLEADKLHTLTLYNLWPSDSAYYDQIVMK